MKRLFLLLFTIILSLSAVYPPATLLAAPGDITVVSSAQENKFPNEIIFRLEARSSAEIKKVTLFYRIGEAKVQSYAYPSITPGTSIKTEYSLNTQKTYIPPTTEITYQWQIDDAAGNSLKTNSTSFSYDDVRFKWNKLTKDGLTIYWYKGSQAFAEDLLSAAAAAIKRISSEIGITYEHPMRIVVYDSKTDMDSAMPKKSDTYTRETITLGVRLSGEVLALLANQADVKQTLAHELSHMVVHQLVENPYSDIPAWLDEGLSMVAEGELPPGNKRALDDGIRRDGLLSVRSMTSYSGDPAKVNLFYAESYSVVRFLLDNYGRDKMAQLLRVFKEGNTADDALRTVYGFTTDELDAKWRTSLGLSPRPSKDTSAEPGATPIPTFAPLRMPGQAQLDRGLVMAGIAIGLCVVVLLLAVVVVAVVMVRRRR